MRLLFHQFGVIHEQWMMRSLKSFLRNVFMFQYVASIVRIML